MKKAYTVIEYGQKAINKARTRNPKTCEIIQAKLDEIKSRIDMFDIEIKREQDRLTNFDKVTEVLL